MASYVKISSPIGGSHDSDSKESIIYGLKRSIIYIGKHRDILKEWRKEYIEKYYASLKELSEEERHKMEKEYFKCGIEIIAKNVRGSFVKTAIRCMVKPGKAKKNYNKKWCYHKRIYGEAYGEIIRLLFKLFHKCPSNDKDYIKELLNDLYLNICKESEVGNELERSCSNTLLYWQKNMLELFKNQNYVSIYNKEGARGILKKIEDVDGGAFSMILTSVTKEYNKREKS